MLVINDGSDRPVADEPHVADLLSAISSQGHEVRLIRTQGGARRHQLAMEAVPDLIEVIVRIDDDVVPTPTFLAHLLRPFSWFSDLPVAAVGGCVPQPELGLEDLDVQLQKPGWVPTVDEPTWRLQGHPYRQREVLEVESLLGHAIAYRRSAVVRVGGFAVDGYSSHAFREESDLCARLRADGRTLLVTTEAIAWHLYAPGGGSREVRKTPGGVHLVSDAAPLEADERLFRARLVRLKEEKGLRDRPLRRFSIEDLDRGRARPRSMRSWRGALKSAVLRLRSRLPEPARALARRIREGLR